MDKTSSTTPPAESIQNRIAELRRRAAEDPLSGLLNRGALEQSIAKRLQDMAPEDTCALFIIDLDDFKQVNDTLGHQAGDQAIRQSARILSSLFRASDIVGRLGGDEFAVFLCGKITEQVAREKAAVICERLHLALGDQKIVNLTASVGVYLTEKGQEFDGLYQAADLALYKAKKAGKHQYSLKSRSGYQTAPDEEFRPVNTIPLTGLLEQMGSGVALLEMGPTPQVIYVSPSFCRIIDADIKTFSLPKALSELIHPEDLPLLEQTLRDGLAHRTAIEHMHRISGDGGLSWFWWQIRAIQVKYDNPNPVMLITAMDVTRFKEAERHRAEEVRDLRIALNQTAKRLWEVDISTGVLHTYTRDGAYRQLGDGKIPFPENLIQGGWIHPNSVSRVRTFAEELLGGRAQGFGNFAVRNEESGCYSWASVSYRTLYDEAGQAVRAVGVLEEIPQVGGLGSWHLDQSLLPERLLADLIVRMRANLDQDTVEALWIEGSDLSGQVLETRCSQILQREQRKVFSRSDQQDLLAYFSREHLLKLFQAGQRWLCAEYRRVDSAGNIRWVRHVLHLAGDPATGQAHLFVYLIQLDPNHLLEPAIHRTLNRDPVTRLFDKETVQKIAEALFSSREGGNRAVALLQVNGLPQEPPFKGADANRMRYTIAVALSLLLGGGCVLGQYGFNQIVIVFPSVAEREELHHCLEEVVALLRRILTEEPGAEDLRFLVGVHLMPSSTAVYNLMLSQAVRVCAFWWNAAADKVAFVPENEDWDWSHMPQSNQDDQVSVFRPLEKERPLSEREKDVALKSVSVMLSARTLDASLQGVLETIGEYYRADRVYTLMLVEHRQAVVMTFEWTRHGKRSIQQVVSGMQLERFPMLGKCMAERAPLLLRRNSSENGSDGGRPWYFGAIPLIRGQEVEGFLCIENAREQPEDGALFSTLIPFMLQQRERFGNGERPTGTIEQLMGLPDLRAYTQTVYTLTSEYYSSLGVVCLDIPGFAAVNSSRGFEYGSKMLWYVAKTMKDLFGSALLFRTWESEFVIFYPNTTREVFLGRCGRLRSILQRRYPNQVRIGRVWAEGVFTGKRLANEAKAAMRAGGVGYMEGAEQFPLQADDYSTVTEATRAGRFLVYYQPKIDMRTGALAGAEALVRTVADDGSIVLPGRFIEFLEEDGSIRELDLFVLEQALSQADQWRSQGLGIVPVAVNLSRVTLAHPSALASILAIQSRYPEVPTSALELEVTERGDGIKTAELQSIVEKFHACGLHMSLDDFGSQYANFSLFTNVKFETVKLDRSLIAELASNPMNRTLVRDLIQICRAYGMTCVAEGVETEAQVSTLLESGCVYGQGFYYSRPVPAREFEETFLRSPAQGSANVKEGHT